MIEVIKKDKDPMIQKAISWVLREMIRAGFNQEVGNPTRIKTSSLPMLFVK